jgi:hypothetical protein
MTDTTTTAPTVTGVRTALIREAADYGERRRAHHAAMRAMPVAEREENPYYDALFDAYEGFAKGGGYAQTLAAVLRIVAGRDPKTAAELALLIEDVMENGDDCLDGPNDDVWARVESERAEKAAGLAATP